MITENVMSIFRQFMALAEIIPLPLFVFIGSIVEDLIAPIPSPALHGVVGSIAKRRDYNWIMLLGLIILSSLGKTIAASVFYFIADKFEDKLPPRFFKLLKIDKKKIEAMGEKLSKGKKDDIIIFLLRAWPISPSLLISLTAGFLKTNFRTFFISTFLGYLVPTTIYILAGFHGTKLFSGLSLYFGFGI